MDDDNEDLVESRWIRNSRQIVDVYAGDKFVAVRIQFDGWRTVSSIMYKTWWNECQEWGTDDECRDATRSHKEPSTESDAMQSKLTLINDNEYKEEIKQVYDVILFWMASQRI